MKNRKKWIILAGVTFVELPTIKAPPPPYFQLQLMTNRSHPIRDILFKFIYVNFYFRIYVSLLEVQIKIS